MNRNKLFSAIADGYGAPDPAPRAAAPVPVTGLPPAMKPSRILRLPEVESLTGLRKSTLYARMREQTFPACVRLSARAVGWRESDIAAWLAQLQQGGAGHD